MHWESKTKLSTWSWHLTFGISLSSAEGISVQPIQNTFALFRGHRQNTRTHNFVLKKSVYIDYSNNVLARCDSIFLLLRCQGVWNKTCTQLSLSQILVGTPTCHSTSYSTPFHLIALLPLSIHKPKLRPSQQQFNHYSKPLSHSIILCLLPRTKKTAPKKHTTSNEPHLPALPTSQWQSRLDSRRSE